MIDPDAPLPALALDAQRNLLRCGAIAILMAPTPLQRTRMWMRYRRIFAGVFLPPCLHKDRPRCSPPSRSPRT